MILQSLLSYYEALAQRGELPRPGWATVKVSYALEIDSDGRLLGILPLQVPSSDGKKMLPREMLLPAPIKRSGSGSLSNFLWDNAMYMLGPDCKGDAERAKRCFEAAKELHLQLLSGIDDCFAIAVTRFFENLRAGDNSAVAEIADELAKGENLTFMFDGKFPTDSKAMCVAWQKHYDDIADGEKMRCLVTGDSVVPASTHPSVKGVRDAQSVGAALVSFNAPAFCSYDREQNLNAPVGKYAAFAYTTALNHLLSQKNPEGRQRAKLIGDTTVVFWSEDAQPQYQNAFAALLDGSENDTVSANDLEAFVDAVANGNSADWDSLPVNPVNHFYVLGLAPNAARLSVRFFLRDSFGSTVMHIKEHYDRMKIVSDNRSKWHMIPLWAMLQETVNQKSRDISSSPQMSGDTLRAILTGGRYPATLYQQTMLRIKAEREITRGRAAIIKAYLLRNSNNKQIKEVLSVELNEETKYQPYVLGRIFSVLEAIQQRANPGINTTIKDKYFSSACATPAAVFPMLFNLAEKHMRKMNAGSSNYSKQLGELTSAITESYPVHLTLADQGIFQLGYYHQTQKRYEKKNTNYIEEEK